MPVPNCIARLTLAAALGRPSCLNAALSSFLSPCPGTSARLARSHNGSCKTLLMYSSSKNGCLASLQIQCTTIVQMLEHKQSRSGCHPRQSSHVRPGEEAGGQRLQGLTLYFCNMAVMTCIRAFSYLLMSATSRSSLPRFRCHRRRISIASSSCNPTQPCRLIVPS